MRAVAAVAAANEGGIIAGLRVPLDAACTTEDMCIPPPPLPPPAPAAAAAPPLPASNPALALDDELLDPADGKAARLDEFGLLSLEEVNEDEMAEWGAAAAADDDDEDEDEDDVCATKGAEFREGWI
jgi:hypothetical protein